MGLRHRKENMVHKSSMQAMHNGLVHMQDGLEGRKSTTF